MSSKRNVSFSIIIIFIVLFIIGCSLVPLLSVKLNPSRELPGIKVAYSWAKCSGRILEKEVTARLEGVFNSIKGVKEIKSQSSSGQGNIQISFNKGTNMDVARFEVATLIRQVYPELPEGVSYPFIKVKTGNEESSSLLVYTLNGSSSPYFIQKYAEENLVPHISLLKGINDIKVYGANPFEWEICYQTKKLQQLGIKANEVQKAVSNFFDSKELGVGWETTSEMQTPILKQVYFSFRNNTEFKPERIPVGKVEQRIVYLGDIAKIRYKEKVPDSYFRINGLNTINMVVSAEKTANQLDLANKVKAKIEEMKTGLPAGYSILLSYDTTEFIQKELEKIAWRTGLSLLILLLFVLLISKRWRYLLLILISLLINLAIAVVFYYLLGLELHLYAMAGITVSLGMMIDSSIVMIDHLRHQGNKKAFLAILAATLTTIGSLSVIFFLGEEQKIKLIDFALVMIINLAVSLAIALFLIPALLQKLPLAPKKNKLFFRRKRRVLIFTNIYASVLLFMKRWRVAFLIIIVLAFGLPLHLLPEKLDGDGFWDGVYNKSFGSSWYQDNVKETAEKVLGGSLRLFAQNVFANSFYSEPERTKLNVRGKMPEGATLIQLNEAIMLMENFLSKFDEIDQFQTSIYNSRNGQIQILFTQEAENSSFPYQLKNLITDKAISMGGMDWGVNGVGRGFSNEISTGNGNSHITLCGYNYEQLYAYAERLKMELLKHSRIKKADIVGRVGWHSESKHEYRFYVDEGLMATYNSSYSQVYNYLTEVLGAGNSQQFLMGGELKTLRMVSDQAGDFDMWQLRNLPIPLKDRSLKLHKLAQIKKERTGNSIYKKNQEYQLVIQYDFIGPHQLGKIVSDEQIKKTQQVLPLGYRVEKSSYGSWWNNENKTSYWLILLVVGIIYFICSILLESLLQPLAVIGMIPISFIGVFVTFSLFELNFDQGGYAAFILLCGISVNAALYIINDLNNLKRLRQKRIDLKLYLKAFNHKIIPILLTIISTILGLIPFLVSGQNEVFWFALAAGTIGGLLFSLLAIIFFLPLWFIRAN
ncbi:efflux RND transporter permease subunit [Labilibaculum sp. DW002]|uniref:Efflux RND transporter permease subunit n=1 Tax=Paralabilibaculum antarcticum TaxID=2912572 RepID=A0ABT5VR70_9BACT|nr:efflux RND transporter permease subunit [Labilibaculum sp. DW002]MDE5417922.1 efflux RND transporter permease subunit [Labilibaculum sp. DW002]